MITGTFSRKKLCDLVKNQHFCHKKADSTPFHDFSASQPSWSAKKEQDITTAKFRQNRISYSNTPEHAKNWLFWGIFFIFSVFEVHFLRILNPKSVFLSIKIGMNGMKYLIWPINATSVQKTLKFDQKRNCPPFKARCPPQILLVCKNF